MQLAVSLCSSSSIVSQIPLPLVSGKQTTNNPQSPTTTPNTPYDTTPSLALPAAASIGLKTPPNTTACLTIERAEFLTQVGNSSIVNISNTLKAEQALKKDTSSNPICNSAHGLKPFSTERMLQTPLRIVKTRSELLLFSFPIRKKATKEAGSSDKAFNVTLK